MNDDQHIHTDVIESDGGPSSPERAAMVHVRVLQEMARRHAERIGEIAAQIRAIDNLNGCGMTAPR